MQVVGVALIIDITFSELVKTCVRSLIRFSFRDHVHKVQCLH